MKNLKITTFLKVLLPLLFLSNSAFSQYKVNCNLGGTLDTCGGSYVSIQFNCTLISSTLPSGCSRCENSIGTVIQGQLPNSESMYTFIMNMRIFVLNVRYKPHPTIQLVSPVVLCEGVTNMIKTNETFAGLNYTWVSPSSIIPADNQNSHSLALLTGDYSVTVANVNDSVCSGIATKFVLVSPDPVLIEKEIIKSTGCTNGSKSGISIKAIEGSDHYKYHWNTGDTLSVINCLADSNYYKVTVIDTITHCVGSDSIWLAADKSDSIEILREQNTLLRIDTAVKAWEILYLKNQLAQGKYTSYDTLNISLVLHDTTYVIDMHNLDTIVNLNGFTSQIKIYPNPVGEILNIECSDEITKCEIYNLSGVIVISNNINTTKTQLDVSSLVTGEYLLKISLARGGTMAGRMMIKK